MTAETGSPAASVPTPLKAAEPPAPEAAHVVDKVRAEAMRANMSAIMTADVEDLRTAGTAIGVATVGHDLELTTSAAALVSAKGDVTMHQAGAWALIGGGDVSVSQGGSWVVVAKDYSVETGGNGVVAAAEANVSHGFVGFLLAPRATLSDDSRVIIDSKGALIIGAAFVLGLFILGLFGARAARGALAWRPKLPGLHWQ